MKWWQEAVVYQVYPRSFQDSNDDGIGDIAGIIARLDYIATLGANVIWLSPVYQSPNDDNGYDISDYYNIMSEFGTMKDMDRLIAEAERRDIKIVMDLVANHTSVAHAWFQEALRDEQSVYRDYYYFYPNTGTAPNDLQSIFLGSAWQLTDDESAYYLHMFAPSQADLNWHNPHVRRDIYAMINWWLARGIAGFRLDVIDFIAKDIDRKIITDGPLLHDYIQEMTRATFSHYDVMTVGETWGADAAKAIKYSNLDGSELSMIFNFSHILLDQAGDEKWDYQQLDVVALKKNFNERQQSLYQKGWDALFWNNHDLPRVVSRWGNDRQWRVQSAKMFGTLLHFMQGTPYIYQGEELGMTNVRFASLSDYRDIETLNMYRDRLARGYTHDDIMASIYHIGRDNARTPMQWNDQAHAGFSSVEPWLAVNPNYRTINVADQLDDPQSVFHHYRQLIALRRHSPYTDIIRDGRFDMIAIDDPSVFAYRRTLGEQSLVIACNVTAEPVAFAMAPQKIVLSNYADVASNQSLRPYEAVVYEPQ